MNSNLPSVWKIKNASKVVKIVYICKNQTCNISENHHQEFAFFFWHQYKYTESISLHKDNQCSTTERRYQLTQKGITNMSLKSYFKQNSRYTSAISKQRSSRTQMFCKKSILKNFLKPATLLKKSCFIEHLQLLLLKIYLWRCSS